MPTPVITRLQDAAEQPYPLHGDLRVRQLLGAETGACVTMYVARVAPGEEVAVTAHDVDETVYIASGMARLPDGTELDAGTCVHLPAGTPHGLSNTGPRDLVLELLIHQPGA